MHYLRRRWRQFWNAHFADPLAQTEAEMRTFLNTPEGRGLDRKTVLVLLSVAVALAVHEYTKSPLDLLRCVGFLRNCGWHELADRLGDLLQRWSFSRIDNLTWWATSTALTYFGVPLLVIKCMLHERLVDFGLDPRKAFYGWPIYAVMAACMAPVVAAASLDQAFLDRYPFYPLAPGEAIPPDFLRWEFLYALQFIGLEFFFRGYMVHGVRHRFGVGSAFVMTIPYCMIHFGKPLPETLAAIVAGVVLGVMSLKTRSIWLGAALHITVAWTMDLLALWRKGHLTF